MMFWYQLKNRNSYHKTRCALLTHTHTLLVHIQYRVVVLWVKHGWRLLCFTQVTGADCCTRTSTRIACRPLHLFTQCQHLPMITPTHRATYHSRRMAPLCFFLSRFLEIKKSFISRSYFLYLCLFLLMLFFLTLQTSCLLLFSPLLRLIFINCMESLKWVGCE